MSGADGGGIPGPSAGRPAPRKKALDAARHGDRENARLFDHTERVGDTARQERERARPGPIALRAADDVELALEHLERLVLVMVHVQRWREVGRTARDLTAHRAGPPEVGVREDRRA